MGFEEWLMERPVDGILCGWPGFQRFFFSLFLSIDLIFSGLLLPRRTGLLRME